MALVIVLCISGIAHSINLIKALTDGRCEVGSWYWQQLANFTSIECYDYAYPGYLRFFIDEPMVMLENSDFDGAYITLSSEGSFAPLDVYAFWYTPDDRFVSIDGRVYNQLQEVRPVLENWNLPQRLSLKFFIPNPGNETGRYILFLGARIADLSHSFSWDGWVTALIVDLQRISFDYGCERFKNFVKSIKTLNDLWNFIKIGGIHWNNILRPWLKEHPEYNEMSPDDTYIAAQKCGTPCCGKPIWRFTCSDIANFIIEVLKINKEKWGIVSAWPLGIHADDNVDFNSPGGVKGFRHVVALAYLENGTWIIMDENAFATGMSLKEVLGNYKAKFNEHGRLKLHQYTRSSILFCLRLF